MGKKLNELDAATVLAVADIMHLRGLDGVDKKITGTNLKDSFQRLHLLDEADRTSGAWDISTNPTTNWAEHDLSAKVPNGAIAIFGFYYIARTDAQGILLIRDATPGTETEAYRLQSIRSTALYAGAPIIIKATNGIFDIKEYDATTEIKTFIFHLWGWFS